MSRTQLALNVDDLDEAVTFYSKLFNAKPAKRKPGYANFAIAEPPLKLVLIENPGKGGTSTTSASRSRQATRCTTRSPGCPSEGLFTDEEIGTTCCFATQDKVWVTGPAASGGRSTPSSPTLRPLEAARRIRARTASRSVRYRRGAADCRRQEGRHHCGLLLATLLRLVLSKRRQDQPDAFARSDCTLIR